MKYIAIALLASLLTVGGCASGPVENLSDTWDATRDFINPPPSIDTDGYQMSNPNQVKLAKLFSPVDGPLTSLITFVQNTDMLPDVDWLELLTARFPWVNTVLVTDADGVIVLMQPETPLKQLSAPLLFEVKNRREIMTRVDYTDLGPEMYIGRPYYKDLDFRGIIGVGFDPRSLLTLSPDPRELVIIQPGEGVFSRGAADSEALLAVGWQEILAENVHGQVKAGEKYYTWIVRYIGKDPYIYATESVDPGADEGWF